MMQGSITVDELRDLEGAPVHTSDGQEVGHVGEIWYEEDSREARWLKVGRGPLGLKAVFVPVQGAEFREDGVHVPYTVDQLHESPEHEDDGAETWELSEPYDRQYRERYGLEAVEPGRLRRWHDGTVREDAEVRPS